MLVGHNEFAAASSPCNTCRFGVAACLSHTAIRFNTSWPIFYILSLSLWPPFTDAIAHRDIGWIQRSYAGIRRVLTVYSCLSGVIIITAGQWIWEHLMHIDTAGNHLLFCILGVCLVANIWTHVFYVATFRSLRYGSRIFVRKCRLARLVVP
jgi:hypothetical protein